MSFAKQPGVCLVCQRPGLLLTLEGTCLACRGLVLKGLILVTDEGFQPTEAGIQEINMLRRLQDLEPLGAATKEDHMPRTKPPVPAKSQTVAPVPPTSREPEHLDHPALDSEAMLVDGQALPLLTSLELAARDTPYLLVAKSCACMEIPVALAVLLPPDASYVRLYGEPGAKALGLRFSAAAVPHSRPLCAKKKGAGRLIYCQRVIKALALDPGRYPAAISTDGDVIVSLDRRLGQEAA